MATKMKKFTVKEFNKKFSDDGVCLDWLRQNAFPELIECPTCHKQAKFYRITTRKVFGCEFCGHQISPTAGTIFHKSSTPLTLWFYVIYLMAQTRGGISAKQIERETGVTYKTAWRMCKQVRHMLYENKPKFNGHVEMDESYFGGRRHGKRGRGAAGKTAVFGMVERGGSIETYTVPNVRRETLMPIVDANVARTASVYTDEMHAYKALPAMGYSHAMVPHAEKIYVVGNVHTNTIEGFWSLVKNGIRGVYHAVSSKYLQSYLDEYTFRYNNRKSITPMFDLFLHRVLATRQVHSRGD